MSTTALAKSVRHTVVDTPVGELTLVRDADSLTGIYFPGHWTNPDFSSFGPLVDHAQDEAFDQAIAQLTEYFAGKRRKFDLSVNLQGGERARQVWQLLTEIPYGETTTYGALAKRIGPDVSPRAIGGFVGHNPVSIVIPCHRVIGSTGALTGYGGGLDRKQYLLELEGVLLRTNPLW